MFELYGQSLGEFEVGGCDLSDLTIAATSYFNINRYFKNRCGSSRTIQEVGLHGLGMGQATARCFCYLLARDVVSPGVAVADGEILKVTYTPQITV